MTESPENGRIAYAPRRHDSFLNHSGSIAEFILRPRVYCYRDCYYFKICNLDCVTWTSHMGLYLEPMLPGTIPHIDLLEGEIDWGESVITAVIQDIQDPSTKPPLYEHQLTNERHTASSIFTSACRSRAELVVCSVTSVKALRHFVLNSLGMSRTLQGYPPLTACANLRPRRTRSRWLELSCPGRTCVAGFKGRWETVGARQWQDRSICTKGWSGERSPL